MAANAFATTVPDADIAARQLRLGLEHHGAGRTDEAIAALQLGLAAVENEDPGAVSIETISQLHSGCAAISNLPAPTTRRR
jgi:hypothetical protein